MFKKYDEKKAKKYLVLFAIHLAIGLVLLVYSLYFKCPLKYIFGLPCPSCGMTRAHLALLRGNFKEAFLAHPLFPFALPVIFLLLHNKALNLKLSRAAITAIGFVSLGLLIAVYLLRLFVFKDPVVTPDFESSLLYKIKELF